MVQSLCKQYSPPLLSLRPPSASTSETQNEAEVYHPFPPPSVLALDGVSATLRELGFGYRAEFIQRTAKMLVDKHGAARDPHGVYEASEAWLLTLRNTATTEAREELLNFIGVGRKVADCVLLMSLDKVWQFEIFAVASTSLIFLFQREVIPVDTHVHQIAIKHYGLVMKGSTKSNMTPKIYDEVNAKLVRVWGEYSGWAHSVSISQRRLETYLRFLRYFSRRI